MDNKVSVESEPKIKSRYALHCPNCWGYLDEDNFCRVCKMVIKQQERKK